MTRTLIMDTGRKSYVWGNLLRGRTLDFKKDDLRWWGEFKERANGHRFEPAIVRAMNRAEKRITEKC